MFTALLPVVLASAADAFEPAQCRAVVVGVLEWKSRGFAPFAKEERQDARFAQVLRERGVPEDHLALLLDADATRANIEAKLAEAAQAGEPGSTLLFYYAGHGTRSGASGCFANYDMTGAADGFGVARIAEIVASRFKGRRVLLFADCCYSGLLTGVVAELGAAGFEAACATSVVAESPSTGNWTFTQTLVEAFSGDPALDADGDGKIVRGELDGAVRAAMAWRESQRAATGAAGLGSDFVLAPAPPAAATTRLRAALRERALPFALGDHVRIDGEPAGVGRLVGLAEGDAPLVRRYAYATREDVVLAKSAIAPIEFKLEPVGAIVGVKLGPDRVAARVVEVDAPFHRLAFPAWPEHPGEWRVATRFGEVPPGFDAETGACTRARTCCMVEWKGSWYPALVLSVEGEAWRIHYLGYGANWDETVGAARIRFAEAGAGAAPPASVDLRDELKRLELGPRGQGARGTCSVFTTCAALEFALAKRRGRAERLSVEFLNWSGSQVIGRPSDGAFFHNALAGFAKFGLCAETSMPYQAKYDAAHAPTAEALAEAERVRDESREGLAVRWIVPWRPHRFGLTDEQFAEVKAVLARGDPVAAGSGHSRLLVGYRDDAAIAGGGAFLTEDSGVARFDEVTYDFVRTKVADVFWVEARERERGESK